MLLMDARAIEQELEQVNAELSKFEAKRREEEAKRQKEIDLQTRREALHARRRELEAERERAEFQALVTAAEAKYRERLAEWDRAGEELFHRIQSVIESEEELFGPLREPLISAGCELSRLKGQAAANPALRGVQVPSVQMPPEFGFEPTKLTLMQFKAQQVWSVVGPSATTRLLVGRELGRQGPDALRAARRGKKPKK